MSKERYLIKMVGCIEPEVHGPYANEGTRTRAVRKIHREMDYEDVIFALDMFPVKAWAYSAGFFMSKEEREKLPSEPDGCPECGHYLVHRPGKRLHCLGCNWVNP